MYCELKNPLQYLYTLFTENSRFSFALFIYYAQNHLSWCVKTLTSVKNICLVLESPMPNWKQINMAEQMCLHYSKSALDDRDHDLTGEGTLLECWLNVTHVDVPDLIEAGTEQRTLFSFSRVSLSDEDTFERWTYFWNAEHASPLIWNISIGHFCNNWHKGKDPTECGIKKEF